MKYVVIVMGAASLLTLTACAANNNMPASGPYHAETVPYYPQEEPYGSAAAPPVIMKDSTRANFDNYK